MNFKEYTLPQSSVVVLESSFFDSDASSLRKAGHNQLKDILKRLECCSTTRQVSFWTYQRANSSSSILPHVAGLQCPVLRYSARTGHAVVNAERSLYLFGGTDGTARQSDVNPSIRTFPIILVHSMSTRFAFIRWNLAHLFTILNSSNSDIVVSLVKREVCNTIVYTYSCRW